MKDHLLLGVSRLMLPIPPFIWQRQVSGKANLDFMSADHHRVRDFVVTEIPKVGKPLSPEYIAHALDLSSDRLSVILDDLEKHMTFLFRDEHGDVEWAYPVTAACTPHHVAFSSGERIDAAWGIDALATPFVQGQLRKEHLSFTITTECAHCHRPLHVEIDTELNYRVIEADAQPLVYAPMVNFGELDDPSIIDAFWRKSIFFWSEEHAKEYRRQRGGERGTYLTLPQAMYVTRLTQSAIFGFPR